MKKGILVMAMCLMFVLSGLAVMNNNAMAAEQSCYIVPGIGQSFSLRSENNGKLSIWGSQIQALTGFSTLTVVATEVPIEVINSWYATLLAFRIIRETVRVSYDDTTGKIIRIGPELQ